MDSSVARLAIFSAFVVGAVMVQTQAQVPFDTNFVELDTSKMITTSDSNYAICNHNFPSNWRSASVNGDEVTISTRDKVVLLKRMSTLTNEERSSLENIKTTLTAVIRVGPYNVKTQTGFAKLTTYTRNGGSSSMGVGNGVNDGSSSSSSTSDGTTIQKTGKDSFIVSKPDLPFNWIRVFVNDDVATVVHRDGRVVMLPQDLMRPDEHAKILALRQEVEKASKSTESLKHSLTNSLKNPMSFVNKALTGFFG